MPRLGLLLLACSCLLVSACEPIAVAVLGAGASAALRYNLDGVASRTFTAPVAAVRTASLAALQRMGITLDSTGTYESGELLFARAENRDIEIEVEPITKQATRVRVTARGDSFLYDNATAVELVQQTEKMLDAAASAKAAVQPAAAAAGGPPRLTAN